MTAKIIPFPKSIYQRPHDPEAWKSKPVEFWTTEDGLEEARFRVASLREEIAELEGDEDRQARLRWAAKCGALKWWNGELIEREAAARGTALTHCGMVFTDTIGRA